MQGQERGYAVSPHLRHVGISEMRVSGNCNEVLVTYSLGSCVGLTLYDPKLRLGGLIHCMLPLASVDPEKARMQPGMFVDSGVTRLLQRMLDRGASRRRLIAKVAGGAAPLDERGHFRIGERNYATVRKLLWRNDILIDAEDVGGNAARSMYLHIADGRTLIRKNREWGEL
ncbi:MAG: chemotaxis protein CheD [Chitinivibrionales bacterium]|nr:chemotaxis protein CheD [Chitinivibrionales bacterium]